MIVMGKDRLMVNMLMIAFFESGWRVWMVLWLLVLGGSKLIIVEFRGN